MSESEALKFAAMECWKLAVQGALRCRRTELNVPEERTESKSWGIAARKERREREPKIRLALESCKGLEEEQE